MMHFVFSADMCRLSCVKCRCTCCNALCNACSALFGVYAVFQMAISSAYRPILEGWGTWRKDEFRAMINRIGLRTEPCMRPVVGVLFSESLFKYLTWKVLLVRYVLR